MKLRFTQSDKQKVYFVSDLHLNHNPNWDIPLWKQRGYNSSKEHTELIINKINEIVGYNDILLNMGDFCLNTSQSEFEELISRINCNNIHYIWGNHNSRIIECYKNVVKEKYHVDDIEVYPIRYRNIIFIGNYAEVIVDGKYFILCHYPISSWNKMSSGTYMIHGHCHGNFKKSLPEEINYGKILDVSWDVFKKPISVNEILNVMNKKKIVTVDHH